MPRLASIKERSMKATRFCLAVVSRTQPVVRPTMGPDVEEVSAFLVSHVRNLLGGSASDLAPLVTFTDAQRRHVFEQLSNGTDEEFLTAATGLTRGLVTEMSRVNSKEGVLVCATFDDGVGGLLSAALKLEVVSDHGAILEQLGAGAVKLSAVEDVLDRPGELQKGLVFPDQRPGSDAVVGDKANQTEARYFLVGMGVTAEEHAKRALGLVAEALVDATTRPREVSAVLRQLGTVEPGALDDVVTAAVEGITLSRPVEEIIDDLAARERPITQVNTRSPLKTTIEAGAVKIDLKTLDLDRVKITESTDGGWDITIHVDVEPRIRPRS
jgi:hypothetical protein